MSTKGVRPNIRGNADNPEVVNSRQLLDRLNKQYKPENGRLQEAVGESLINHASMAMVEENKLATAIAENPDLGTGTATDSKALRDITWSSLGGLWC